METEVKYYAGIGSRQTPTNVLALMENLAIHLSKNNWILRSGGAIRADIAFSKSILDAKKEIFTTKDRDTYSEEIAARHHPAWNKCTEYVRRLHARNAKIILGNDLKTPVKFVVCWTSNGTDIGGTGLGIRIANTYNIPVYNLFYTDVFKQFANKIGHITL